MPCAPCLVRLRTEFNVAFGTRHSDLGCCAGAAHSQANPKSDHEPNAAGWCRARDIGEGPDHGAKPYVDYIMANPVKFPQVKYLIYERVIYYPHTRPGKKAAGAYAYTGPNPHATHLHVSIFDDATHYAGSWYVAEAYGAQVKKPKKERRPMDGVVIFNSTDKQNYLVFDAAVVWLDGGQAQVTKATERYGAISLSGERFDEVKIMVNAKRKVLGLPADA